MIDVFKKLYSLLSAHERRRAALVFVTMLAVAMSEVLGVASVMPFIAVLSNPAIIHSNKYLSYAYALLGFSSEGAFLSFLGALFFCLLVGTLGLRSGGLWIRTRFARNREHVWRMRLLAAYLRQPYGWFLNHHSSELTTAVLSEVPTVINGWLLPAMQMVSQALIVILLLILLIVMDPMLAVSVGLIIFLAYAAISVIVQRKLVKLGAERRTANRQLFHFVQESFGGIKDVKIAGLERRYLDRFGEPSQVVAQRQITYEVISDLPSSVVQALVFGGMVLLLIYLLRAHGSLQQALPFIALYAFAGYRLMPAIQLVYEQMSKLRFANATVDSLVVELATLESSAVAAESSSDIESRVKRLKLREALFLRDVCYRYPGAARMALDAVSVDVPAFHSIGLVGTTGSGKSTLVDVILGLLQPQSGNIVVDGQLVTGQRLRSWQRTIGYVPQQIFLADDSVAGNIAFGLPEDQIDMAAVERAARLANLHDFVVNELPDGYGSTVGERGVRLSGGQRQRIGIARALYHDPDLLVLDEATSALDNLTESAVMEAVRSLARRKTIIMIAHRLSTVRHCDCIYVLEQGRVVGTGSYDTLLDTNESFRRMAESA